MRPLVGIADYIGSIFLSDHNISIYHHCFSLRTMVSFHRHHCWLLYFLIFIFSSHRWVRPLVGIAAYTGSTFLSDRIIAIYHHCFILSQWSHFIITVVDCYIFFSVIPAHGLVQPLVGVADYIGSTFLIDNIIAIYHYHCRVCVLLFLSLISYMTLFG